MRLARSLLYVIITILNVAMALIIGTSKASLKKDLSLTTTYIPFSNSISTTPSHRLSPRQLSIWTPKLEHIVLGVMPLFALPLYYELLSTIYTSILDTILDSIASKPDINQLVIEAGNLRWEFGCTVVDHNGTSNGEATPLPGSFIEEYFESKRDAVERGFASVYEKSWWWEKVDEESEMERVCFAGMRVVEKGEVVVPPDGSG